MAIRTTVTHKGYVLDKAYVNFAAPIEGSPATGWAATYQVFEDERKLAVLQAGRISVPYKEGEWPFGALYEALKSARVGVSVPIPEDERVEGGPEAKLVPMSRFPNAVDC